MLSLLSGTTSYSPTSAKARAASTSGAASTSSGITTLPGPDRTRLGTLDVPNLGIGTIAWAPDTPEDEERYGKFAPTPWRGDAAAIVDACRGSAERLGVEGVDLMQVHMPDVIQPFAALGIENRREEAHW